MECLNPIANFFYISATFFHNCPKPPDEFEPVSVIRLFVLNVL